MCHNAMNTILYLQNSGRAGLVQQCNRAQSVVAYTATARATFVVFLSANSCLPYASSAVRS